MLRKGKISTEELSSLKQAYPDTPLFNRPSKDGKHDAIFRPIDQSLMDNIHDLVADARGRGTDVSEYIIAEKIFDDCVLWPRLSLTEKLDLLPGEIPQMAKSIQEKSGFTEIDIQGNIIGPDLVTVPIQDYKYWSDYTDQEAQEVKASTLFQLFRMRVDRWYFIMRPMTRADQALASEPGSDAALTLCRGCCMWPKEVPWDIVPAGIIDALSQAVIRVSGYTEDNIEVVEI